MGITFGDKAEVKVDGDMVGGDQVKIAVSDDAWQSVAGTIAGGEGDLDEKADAMQALSALRHELAKEEPHKSMAEAFAGTIKRLAPKAFEVLLAAVPELVKMLPGLIK